MRFSPDFIERVKDSNNIVDLISQYTQLRTSGGSMMGRCPFPDHAERTPSFSVSETKQVYHCFGCQKSGNIFKFLQTYNGMSFPEAIEYLANRAGLPIPQDSYESQQKTDETAIKKKKLIEINKLACNFFHEQFKNLNFDQPARRYALDRGLTADIIESFKIGYAPAEWEGLETYLREQGVDLNLAYEAGLLKPRTQGKTGYYDAFRNRLMFPIFSPMGDVIGFGGRVLDDSLPKYLNSPETILFHKGKTLYGLNETAKYIRTEDQAIVVEGYMDFIALYQYGFKNVVANLGTALTADHGKALGRITKNIVVLFDGDSAGQRAAVRSLPILLSAGVIPKGITLPDELDPDEFLKERGRDSLKLEISHAKDLFAVVLQQWLIGYKAEPSQKIKVADALRPILGAIEDKRLREIYIGEAALRMGVEPRWLSQATLPADNAAARRAPFSKNLGFQDEISKQEVDQNQQNEAEILNKVEETIKLVGAPKLELVLMKLALKESYLMDILLAKDGMDFVTHSGVKAVLQRAIDVYRQSENKFDTLVSLLMSVVDRPSDLLATDVQILGMNESTIGPEVDDVQAQMQRDTMRESVRETEKKMFLDCLQRLEEKFLVVESAKLAQEVKQQSSPEKLERFMSIQRRRLALGKSHRPNDVD
jgi:DNA primase